MLGEKLRVYPHDQRFFIIAAIEDAPWYVVPADNKWFTRVIVAAAVIDTVTSLNLSYPKVSKEKLKELAAVKRALTTK